jgi:ubiquinone/menaquinone biosynthesis C-methylase UbiE
MKVKDSDRKNHWERIYNSKELRDLSWYQPIPSTSLDFVSQLGIKTSAKIIDIGGGDSLFVDHLLKRGYQDITVLDISENAIARAKQRLGDKAKNVKWVVSDVINFKPAGKFDFWHDRATFHFLTIEKEIETYLKVVRLSIYPSGVLVIGTFSDRGPERCSGLKIKQYSEESIAGRLKKYFEKIKCIIVDHTTPFNTIQNFIFCSFRKLDSV